MAPYVPTGRKRGRPRDPNKRRPARPGPPPEALRVRTARGRDDAGGTKRAKETLADRVEKAVAISMTEEERAAVEKERREAAMYWPVCLNPKTKPKGAEVSDDRMSFTSSKGYRTCAASHGVKSGAFYFEVTIARLGESGHARNAPVGFDKYGYGYKDIRGEKTHEAVTAPYGEPFFEGDVIGCYVYVDKVTKRDDVKDEKDVDGPTNSSFVAFSRNGVFQGKAYEGLNDDDGAYFPCGSLFTDPGVEPARLVFNFGPNFAHPPNAETWGVPEPRPMSDLDPPRPPPEIKPEPPRAEEVAVKTEEAPVFELPGVPTSL
ncbi:histone H3 methyltransferase complex, subunit CPS60/ASH2/BRE2 [Ostreococcus tauri]|uniref:Histone H3 methyltransferase complex, subunit CPS60/ASH2/BRE2 n=1 Tax=Ostreococcus tauri TaxID=70448 RepID=A0A1Y5I1H6_OSTTA|nr:histone H3 methyltransferase complex, subunit CPS60/ASH2/BRE2 [Ostreococcus tauri]